jgi:hypothetical protein
MQQEKERAIEEKIKRQKEESLESKKSENVWRSKTLTTEAKVEEGSWRGTSSSSQAYRPNRNVVSVPPTMNGTGRYQPVKRHIDSTPPPVNNRPSSGFNRGTSDFSDFKKDEKGRAPEPANKPGKYVPPSARK